MLQEALAADARNSQQVSQVTRYNATTLLTGP